MAKRTGGFIGQDGINAPDPATGVSGTAGDTQVDVSFTPPSDAGGAAVTGYRVQDNTGAFGASGSASPITVTGLTNGASYTFNVWAINPFGWSSPSDASGSVSPQGVAALFQSNYEIAKITISSTGNAVDFGDMLTTRNGTGGVGNATIMALGGGTGPSSLIEYGTYASGGSFASWGNLANQKSFLAGAGNNTRGLFNGGSDGSARFSSTDYITYSSTGSVSDFGNSGTAHGDSGCTAAASTTRAIFAGGESSQNTRTSVIDYCTISSTGSFSSFGNLIQAETLPGGCSNSTRAVFAGGGETTNRIQYLTISSTGNATDFGDLTVGRPGPSGLASSTRAVFASGASSNVMDYITISSTGNATDFGDALGSDAGQGGSSNGHGGLS